MKLLGNKDIMMTRNEKNYTFKFCQLCKLIFSQTKQFIVECYFTSNIGLSTAPASQVNSITFQRPVANVSKCENS